MPPSILNTKTVPQGIKCRENGQNRLIGAVFDDKSRKMIGKYCSKEHWFESQLQFKTASQLSSGVRPSFSSASDFCFYFFSRTES